MAYTTQVDGTPSRKEVTYYFIDFKGDKTSLNLKVPADATTAQIEALGVALGAASRANLYRVDVSEVYASEALASSASNEIYVSSNATVVINFKDGLLRQGVVIPAPNVNMVGPGETIVTDNNLYDNVKDAADALLGGGYVPITARFSETRDKNRAVPA